MLHDDENRLSEVTYPGGGGSVTDTYEYNALGQRMRATLDGTVWRYVYNGDRVLQETDDSGVEQARHLTESGSYYDPWLGMKRVENSVHFFPLYDGVGHVRKLTTPGGGGAGSYTYGAFGRYLFGSGSTQNPHKYGGAWGYITDPSGLLQLGARFYWPEVGRFVQQDPIGKGINWYAYVGNNPVVRVDPTGRVWVDWSEVSDCLSCYFNPAGPDPPGTVQAEAACTVCAIHVAGLVATGGFTLPAILLNPACTVCGAFGAGAIGQCIIPNIHWGPNPSAPPADDSGDAGPCVPTVPHMPVPGGIAPPSTPWSIPTSPTYY